jgi:osmotically-inducible protein OsmY
VADAAATVLRWTVGAPDGVEVSALDGRVTLEGTVASRDEQQAAGDLVKSLVGVKAVDNRIVVAVDEETF